MKIKQNIPNFLTCCNLLCGCFGIICTSCYELDKAFYLLIIAAVFDFLDGFAARLLKVSSAIGKDLDSLADMVTFGLLPGFIMYKTIALTLMNFNTELATEVYTLFSIGESTLEEFGKMNITFFPLLFFPFIAFLIPVFSAIRLAKFNNDPRQSDSFIGLPTPANGILIAGLGYLLIRQIDYTYNSVVNASIYNVYVLGFLTCILCYLLISELPLFALKFKSFGWKGNEIRYIFLGLSLGLLIGLQYLGIPLIIILYIVLSLINNLLKKKNPLSL